MADEFPIERNPSETRPFTLDISDVNDSTPAGAVAVSSCVLYDEDGVNVSETYLTGDTAVAGDKLSINTQSFKDIVDGLHQKLKLVYTVATQPYVAIWFIYWHEKGVEN